MEEPKRKKRRKLGLEVSEGAICGRCERAFAVLGVKGQKRRIAFCPYCGNETGQDLTMRRVPRTWTLTRKLEPVIKRRGGVIDVDVAGDVPKWASGKPKKKAPRKTKPAGWCVCPWNAHTAHSDDGVTYVCDGCGLKRKRV